MTSAAWCSTVCIIALFVVIAVVAVDRNRLRHRLDNSEGRVSGLFLDVSALQERVERLSSYLNRPESWEVGAKPPATLVDGRPVDRWVPHAPVTRPTVTESDVSQRASRQQDSAR